MNQSPSIIKLAPALLKAQKQIKGALKDSTNPHFKSKYADLSSVIEAVKVPLNDNGITFLQAPVASEGGVGVETMLLHESGEWLSSVAVIPLDKLNAQGAGSAITYGRRYGLQSMCGVPAEDDDGNAASTPHKPSDGAMDSLTADMKIVVQDIASDVSKMMASGDTAGALDWLEAANFDAEQKIACWSLLSAPYRSAIKRLQEERKAK